MLTYVFCSKIFALVLKLFSYDAHISYVIWDDIAVDFRFSLSIWHAKLDGETVNPRPGIVGHFA